MNLYLTCEEGGWRKLHKLFAAESPPVWRTTVYGRASWCHPAANYSNAELACFSGVEVKSLLGLKPLRPGQCVQITLKGEVVAVVQA